MCFFRRSAFVLKYWYWLQLCGLIATCKDFSWSFAIWLPIQTPRLMVWSSKFKENWIQESSNVRLWLKSVSNHIGRLWSSDKKRSKTDTKSVIPPWGCELHFQTKTCYIKWGIPCLILLFLPRIWRSNGCKRTSELSEEILAKWDALNIGDSWPLVVLIILVLVLVVLSGLENYNHTGLVTSDIGRLVVLVCCS